MYNKPQLTLIIDHSYVTAFVVMFSLDPSLLDSIQFNDHGEILKEKEW